ncbi:MAG: acyl-CoA dehydrogenase family protein [Candidatus Krumholzibacteria bacterium]|nr:acyl-CoA dehydrogenase family protein [Candidatus Krumholzibacteria bacterium]MDH4336411.1 acyl-CoA dehydrogenase family protein [Candidatus Krumholzibacteria bacterium]MDH5269536.1 acyl-CoA dehydrogenase family protein [Candidatus Krumholzibacteria bacterium]
MDAQPHLQWPFLDDTHRALAARASAWTAELAALRAEPDAERATRALVRSLGGAGLLAYAAGVGGRLDVRALCVLRETLAAAWGLADFAFAMQGLGSAPIALFGSEAQREKYLPRVAGGEAVAAFALSEAGAGSDVGAIATTARRDGGHYVLDGEKRWISNGGIADFYVVFVRTGEGPATKGLSAIVVDAGTAGLDTSDRVEVIAPHPMANLRFDGCRVPVSNLVGDAGRGIAVALGTLDTFRATVGAAAVGLARHALAEALAHATTRHQFGAPLSDYQLIRAKLADMATAIDASALLVYRAAWTRDTRAERVTLEAGMAKAFATESAQRVIDEAVQILGALGVCAGSPVEELYREIRPLRIYEGTTEIQKLVIARALLDRNGKEGTP